MFVDYKKQNRQLAVFKMLANANRLKIIKVILAAPEQKLNVTNIARQLKMPLPKISDHLKLLKLNKVLQAKRNGSRTEYFLAEENIHKLMAI